MPQAEETNVQDKSLEGKPESDLHTEAKPTEESLPEGVKDRTAEQFEKLKETNRTLKERLEAYEKQTKAESVLDSLKPKKDAQATPTNQPAKRGLVDESGYVDTNALESSISNAEKKAIEAEKKAMEAQERLAKFEETQQIKTAHEMYPELDPNSSNFDQKFFNLVRNELIGQMMSGEKDVLKAASTVKSYYQPVRVEEKEAQKAEEAKEQKANINAGQNRSGRVSNFALAEESELIQATRKGKKGALAERLKRAGY